MLYGQVKDSIASTFLVAHYDYTCRTSDNKGENHIVNYGLTLQVAQDMACTMGQKRHDGENDRSEQLLYVPTTWQNYPEGNITSAETIPPYHYLTTEKMVEIKWTLLTERDTICGLPCQKATGTYGGSGVDSMVYRKTAHSFWSMAIRRSAWSDCPCDVSRQYSSF